MLARLAPLSFALLWSSSFVASKIGLEHLSPLLFVGVRLGACAAVLLTLMLVMRRSWRPLGGWRWLHCGVAGALLNGVGLMAPHVGLLTVPAAQVALVQSLTPLLTAALGVVLLRERLARWQWGGLALGVLGVALVVGQAAVQSPTRFEGLAIAFLGVLGLVSGTLYFGRFCRGVELLPGAFAQFTAAALVTGLAAWTLETPRADWNAGGGRGAGLEHRGDVTRRHGAVFADAGARHGGADHGELLPGAGHRRRPGLGPARRAAGRAGAARPGDRLPRLLAGERRRASPPAGRRRLTVSRAGSSSGPMGYRRTATHRIPLLCSTR